MSDYPARPQTPQAMLHRAPEKPDLSSTEGARPSKYIILITASTAVAGKVQIARSVANALACPLYQGDSLHETCAKAASVGASKRQAAAGPDDHDQAAEPVANEARYQRMWLSKMTRTGLLFPEESRPANEECSGSSTSTSRRGSTSSLASETSSIANSFSMSSSSSDMPNTAKYVNKPTPTLTLSEDEKLRKANPGLMLVTHPELKQWHKDSIRKAVGDYSIAVIFVPLDESEGDDEELPVLKPLDPTTMTSFASLGSVRTAQRAATGASLDDEIVLRVNVEAKVEDLIEDIADGAREIMSG